MTDKGRLLEARVSAAFCDVVNCHTVAHGRSPRWVVASPLACRILLDYHIRVAGSLRPISEEDKPVVDFEPPWGKDWEPEAWIGRIALYMRRHKFYYKVNGLPPVYFLTLAP